MGPARLLAERKDQAGQDRRGERATGKPRAPAEQHEIERHQCKPGRRVRAWVAACTRQTIRAVAEQGHVRPAAAIAFEVARTVDIGDLLQPADHGRAEQERRGDENRAAAQRLQPLHTQAGDCRDQRGQADNADEPAATRVDQVHRPPGPGADPGLRDRIVEPGVCDAQVDRTGDRQRGRKKHSGRPGLLEPGPRRGAA